MPPAPKTFHVYSSGNNTVPIVRGLLARGFESVDDDAKVGEKLVEGVQAGPLPRERRLALGQSSLARTHTPPPLALRCALAADT